MIQFKYFALFAIAFGVSSATCNDLNTSVSTNEEIDKLELELTASAEVTDYLVGQTIEVQVRLR